MPRFLWKKSAMKAMLVLLGLSYTVSGWQMQVTGGSTVGTCAALETGIERDLCDLAIEIDEFKETHPDLPSNVVESLDRIVSGDSSGSGRGGPSRQGSSGAPQITETQVPPTEAETGPNNELPTGNALGSSAALCSLTTDDGTITVSCVGTSALQIGNVPSDLETVLGSTAYDAQVVDFSNNFFNDISLVELVRAFPNAQVIRVSSNNIRLSEPISVITNASPSLVELDLQYNYIETVEPQALYENNITENTVLQILRLDGNYVTTFDTSVLGSSRALTTLGLSDNQVQAIVNPEFTSTPSLRTLDLSFNRIENLVDQSTFSGTPRLSTLNLSHNFLQVAAFQDWVIIRESSLTSLSLAFNGIDGLSDLELANSFTTLEFLNLTNNNLELLSSGASSSSSEWKLQTLDIRQNAHVEFHPSLWSQITTANVSVLSSPESICSVGNMLLDGFCIACSPGSYSINGTSCIQCPVNQFTTEVGSTSCRSCPLEFDTGYNNDKCQPLQCGSACIVSISICSFFPIIAMIGTIIAGTQRRKARHIAAAHKAGKVAGRNEQLSLSEAEVSRINEILQTDESLNRTYIPEDQIVEGKVISSGAFGEVLTGTYCGGKVALKRMLPHRINAVEVAHFAREIQLMMSLRHPNILQFIGVTWTSYSNVCVVSEFLDRGDLHRVLHDQSLVLPWKTQRLQMAIDSAQALAYLHGQSPCIIHRDMKSRNILVSDTFRCKVADFGLSRVSANETMTVAGSNLWLAPEMIRCDRFTEKSDCFSFGIVLSEFVTRRTPYYDALGPDGAKLEGMGLLYDIAHKGRRPSVGSNVGPALKVLIQACTADNPDLRPSAREIARILREEVQEEIDLITDPLQGSCAAGELDGSWRRAKKSDASVSGASSTTHSTDEEEQVMMDDLTLRNEEMSKINSKYLRDRARKNSRSDSKETGDESHGREIFSNFLWE